jgi:CRISPR system Cascade subunit CasA
MNLLTDNWIPVELDGELQQRISLKKLLCGEHDFKIKTFRDDMELATLQLLVCIVQVVLMPENKKALIKRWESPMSETEYQQGIENYQDWFDVLHPETPFMQTGSVLPDKGNKNWASLQKLFMGLPEKSSSSPTSSGFFDTPDEITSISIGDAAIALFQQATNGFSLGGVGYSVGLKGSMPLTTLIVSDTLRKSLWCNVLSREFLQQYSSILTAELQEPTWVIPTHTKIADEHAHHIGLARGLFWQPAKVKLELINGKVTGFYKEAGTCTVKGFWLHPHTPINILRLKENNPKEKPYLSARGDQPLWGQMLSYFYTDKQVANLREAGTSCALVVQQYEQIWLENGIQLAVGGYIKGGSAESLAGRRHEIYSLAKGWQDNSPGLNRLIDFAVSCQQRLNLAVADFVDRANTAFNDRNNEAKKKFTVKEPHFKKHLKANAKQLYFNNSETIMHSLLKEFQWHDDLKPHQDRFTALAKNVFEKVVSPYEHEDKMLEPVIKSRNFLNNMLHKLTQPLQGVENDQAKN